MKIATTGYNNLKLAVDTQFFGQVREKPMKIIYFYL